MGMWTGGAGAAGRGWCKATLVLTREAIRSATRLQTCPWHQPREGSPLQQCQLPKPFLIKGQNDSSWYRRWRGEFPNPLIDLPVNSPFRPWIPSVSVCFSDIRVQWIWLWELTLLTDFSLHTRSCLMSCGQTDFRLSTQYHHKSTLRGHKHPFLQPTQLESSYYCIVVLPLEFLSQEATVLTSETSITTHKRWVVKQGLQHRGWRSRSFSSIGSLRVAPHQRSWWRGRRPRGAVVVEGNREETPGSTPQLINTSAHFLFLLSIGVCVSGSMENGRSFWPVNCISQILLVSSLHPSFFFCIDVNIQFFFPSLTNILYSHTCIWHIY